MRANGGKKMRDAKERLGSEGKKPRGNWRNGRKRLRVCEGKRPRG